MAGDALIFAEPSFVSQNFQLSWKGSLTLNKNMARDQQFCKKESAKF